MNVRSHMTKLIAVAAATLAMIAPVSTANAAPAQPTAPEGGTGWVESNGNKYWFDDGVMAQSKEIFDPGLNAWYWIDADGTMARNKDVFQHSNGGKWVRYDANGHMIKGEDFRNGGWYYFDPVTGAMAKGMKFVPSNGGKWVYYDWITGQMAHGERWVDYDAEHTGWYLFDEHTGAMFHGDTFVRSSGGKWVRYDRTTGKMVKGLDYQDGAWYYFDQNTGAMAHGRTWVPDWNRWVNFDQVTGRHAEGNVGNGNGGNVVPENPTVTGTVWWVTTSHAGVYHTHENCPSLRSATWTHVRSGSLADAQRAGYNRLCRNCEHL